MSEATSTFIGNSLVIIAYIDFLGYALTKPSIKITPAYMFGPHLAVALVFLAAAQFFLPGPWH